ncbi:MAG: protein kinase [Enhygromyxa sp.]
MSAPGQPLPPCPHCRAAHPEELLLCPTTNRALPLEGRMLDRRFRLMRKLGEGGMSTVWMAENIRVRKRVAIKLMHPEYARNPRTLERFRNEATAAGRIGNPHICDILDFGESPLGPYMVMEMLRGQSFAEFLEDQGRIDPPLAVLIICEALKGLIAAHAAGIIHRDLKPENVFLHEPEPGRMLVKLMDFGISKFTEDAGGGRTAANVVMGTPEYMSPEQAAGAANVDARTDIWAMGVMLYRAIGGVEPFQGKTMAALLLALSTEQQPPLSQHVPHLPPGLVAVVERCLAKDPDQRFATAAELFAALTPFQQIVAEGERPQAPTRTGKTAPPGAMSTGYEVAGPPPGPVNALAPTGPVAALPASSAAPQTLATQQPNASLAQQLPPPRQVDDSPTGSSPDAQRDGAGTWSSELNPNLVGPDQSWSMGHQTFADDRPRRRRGGGGWIGWVIGVGVVALLGGGFGVAWSLGVFDGDKRVAGADSSGDETGDETGEIVGDSQAVSSDLPGGETGAIAEGGQDSDAGTEGGDSGATGEASADSGEASADSGGDDGSDPPPKDPPPKDPPPKDPPPKDPPPKDPPFSPGSLIKVGNLYTPKTRGPNGTWASARSYCRSLASKKRFGLSGWRLAKVSELQSFRSEVDKLLYWSSETDGRKAKAVSTMSGKVDERDVGDQTPRAFCVSRR